MNLERLSMLTLVPDPDSRARLREVLASVVYKGDVRPSRTAHEAIEILKSNSQIELIFVGYSLGREKLGEFFDLSTKHALLEHHAVILALERQNANFASKLTEAFMQGVDAFIVEPFSAEDMRQTLLTVREKVQQRRTDARLRALKSMEFLGKEAVRYIDQLWLQKLGASSQGSAALRELRGMSQLLRQILERFPQDYERLLPAVFENCPVPVIPEELKRRLNSKKAPHPGRVVEEVMLQRGLTRDRILGIVRISPEDFDGILAGNASVTEEISRELARVLGKTAREWLSMQRRYDAEKQKDDGRAG